MRSISASALALSTSPSLALPILAWADASLSTTSVSLSPSTVTAGSSFTATTIVVDANGNSRCTGDVQVVFNGDTYTSPLALEGYDYVTRHTLSTAGMAPDKHNLLSTYICDGSCDPSDVTVPVEVVAPAAVPTMGEWAMITLMGLLLAGGAAIASRRFKGQAA